MQTGSRPSHNLSPALLAAQERLLQLRQELGVGTRTARPHVTAVSPPEPDSRQAIHRAQQELARRREQAGTAYKYPTAEPDREWLVALQKRWESTPQHTAAPAPERPAAEQKTVAIHPDLLLAMLKQQQEAAGRVYLLLRHLDHQGRGWLPVEEIRARLTGKQSPLRICGWRRLRQIFQQGMGLFWERDDRGRLWLKGAHIAAVRLQIQRVRGFTVELPLTALLKGIRAVRAHFYAAFHSGRKDTPISRETLEDVTGVPARTQRHYDRIARVRRQRNLAVGPRYTKRAIEEQAWQRGGGVFCFLDAQGQHGAPNRTYTAWHLPNSYEGPHARCSKARRKRLNRKLVDLLKKGTAGNDRDEIERLFWPNGAAVRLRGCRPAVDAYWTLGHTRGRGFVLWNVFLREPG